jgi:hypothetical protein
MHDSPAIGLAGFGFWTNAMLPSTGLDPLRYPVKRCYERFYNR